MGTGASTEASAGGDKVVRTPHRVGVHTCWGLASNRKLRLHEHSLWYWNVTLAVKLTSVLLSHSCDCVPVMVHRRGRGQRPFACCMVS